MSLNHLSSNALPQPWLNPRINTVTADNQAGFSYRSGLLTQKLDTDVDTLLTIAGTFQFNNGGYTNLGNGLFTGFDPGVYIVSMSVIFDKFAGGSRAIWAQKQGDTLRYCYTQIPSVSNTDYTIVSASQVIKLSSTDVLGFYAMQNSGSPLYVGIGLGGQYNSLFSFFKIC